MSLIAPGLLLQGLSCTSERVKISLSSYSHFDPSAQQQLAAAIEGLGGLVICGQVRIVLSAYRVWAADLVIRGGTLSISQRRLIRVVCLQRDATQLNG